MDLLFILIGIGLAIFVILVSYRSISRGIKAKSKLKENQSSEDEEILEKLKRKNLSSEDLKKMYDDLQKKKKDDL
tara:strand:+ start:13066 stop:13290 length:225 start_codon:yes stop_codon:yes gene_type:complete